LEESLEAFSRGEEETHEVSISLEAKKMPKTAEAAAATKGVLMEKPV